MEQEGRRVASKGNEIKGKHLAASFELFEQPGTGTLKVN